MARRSRRAACCVALFVLVGAVGLLPLVALADEGESTPAKESASASMSMEALDTLIRDAPWASRVMLFGRGATLLIGLGLLVFLLVTGYRAYDRRKAGFGPPQPPATPPPALFSLPQALMLGFLGFLVIPQLLGAVAVSVLGELTKGQALMCMALGGVPVALYIVVRRMRVRAPGMRPLRGVLHGFEGFCLATVFVIPAALLTFLLMTALGKPPEVQDLLKEMITTTDESFPWILFVFGVFVAPFNEEALFRGLLYPAVRDANGPGRPGAVRAAVIVSALFAAVHNSVTALFPLFFLALVLTWMFQRTNSLVAVFVAHAANNLLSTLPLMLARYGI